jgi:tyramine---L-glutamate ligase
MKVFVYEHITSGALINESLPASLAREGNEMLAAVVHDMALLTNIELSILRDFRLEPLLDIVTNPNHQCLIIDNDISFHQHFIQTIKHADAVLIIAPGTDGLLQNLQQSVLNQGTQLLGCQPIATQICTDKIACYQQLTSNNVLTPYTVTGSNWLLNTFDSASGFIVKPRDGAGCLDTLFFANSSAVTAYLTTNSIDTEQTIVQPYIEGKPLSLSLLCDDKTSRVLAINQQHIQLDDGQLSFHGCSVNSVEEAQFSLTQATVIAQQTHRAIPGLWGFIGIDLIVTDNQAYVVDINPRLTTSYVALHQSLSLNPAQLLLTMMTQGLAALPSISQRHAIEIII